MDIVIELCRQLEALQIARPFQITFAPHLKQNVPGIIDRDSRAITVCWPDRALTVRLAPDKRMIAALRIIGVPYHVCAPVGGLDRSTATQPDRVRQFVIPIDDARLAVRHPLSDDEP